jgi:hypothetical protein
MKNSKYMYGKRCKYSIIVEAIYGWRQQRSMIHDSDRNVKGPKKKRGYMEEENKQFEWRKGCKFEIRALLVVSIIQQD